MSGPFRLLAGCALAMGFYGAALGAERCATGPRIEGKYTIDSQGFAVRSSRHMKLVAVCGYVKNDSGGLGTFRFEGAAEVSGKLWRDDTDVLGEMLWFTADEASAKGLAQPSFMSSYMRVSEIPNAKKILPLPANGECRMATATLRVRAYEYIAGQGTDEDGPYLLDYQLISIGKPKVCVFN